MPKQLSFNELQKSIYDGIALLGYKVYDAVPSNAAFPYVNVGMMNSTDNGTKTNYGDAVYVTIHIFSNYQGSLECNNMIDPIMGFLSSDLLIMEKYKVVHRSNEFIEMLPPEITPDHMEIRHGVIKYLFKIEQK